MQLVDRTGMIYGLLTVIERVPDPEKKVSLWRCMCRCGKEIIVKGGNLNSGNSQSCGCVSLKKMIDRVKTHGRTGTTEYRIYHGMMRRCYEVDNPAYPDYGGRGIKVCDRWRGEHGFENFYADMGPRPKGKTLDRWPNNDGDYELVNCRWATKKEQAENRRSNKWYEFNGLRMIQKDWSRYLGVDNRLFHQWIKKRGFEVAFNRFNKK
jgi:hypothetical protein